MKHTIFTIKNYLIFGLLLCCFTEVRAQQSNSLFFLDRIPNQTQWNPAASPNRSYIGVGIGNIGMSMYSDLAYSDLFIPNKTTGKLDWFLNSSIDKNEWLKGIGSVSDIGMSSDNSIFNIGLKLGNGFLTLSSNLHMDMKVGIPKDFLRILVLGMDANEESSNFDLSSLNMNALSYLKTGIGYSRNFGKLTIGINANYLIGLANIQTGFNELTIDAAETDWSVTSKGYMVMTTPDQIKPAYDEDGKLNGFNSNFSSSSPSDFISNSGSAGTGQSFDFGATYKLFDNLTLTAAVTDLGSIKWKTDAINRVESDGTFNWSGIDFDDENSEELTSSLIDMTSFKEVSNPKSYTSKLTTKVNLGAELGIPSNKLSFGVLSQTEFAENNTYQNFMFSANLKPMSLIQGALTYSLLHGAMSSFGAAVNVKLLFLNLYVAADYIPLKVSPQYIPINNSYFNFQTGFNLMF
jgi:hypothetical protein